MDSEPALFALVAALACVLANAFFVAAEFAFARVRPTALESRARAGDQLAARALKISQQLDAYLTACQLGITFASLGLGWLGEPAIAGILHGPLSSLGLSTAMVHGVATAVAFSIISVLHIVAGELVPKSLAILKPEQLARYTARPMVAFYFAVYPLLVTLNGVSNWLLGLFGLAPARESEIRHSPDEIRLIVEASFDRDDRGQLKRELLERVLRATDRPVRTLMVPRVDMHSLSLEDTMDDWLAEIRKSGFSRYPVTQDGNPDHLRGYVYVKDLLLAQTPPRAGLRGLLRDLLFVPESLPLADVLRRFRRSNIPIAIVVDEYGGTNGLVTVEDVAEELVGDLQDELDVAETLSETRPDGTLVVDGSLSIGDLPLEGMQLELDSHSDTVGGYILERLGRLAHPGDRIQIGQYEATVEDMRKRRIGRVAFRPHRPTTAPPPASPLPPAPVREPESGLEVGKRDEPAS